MFYNIKKGQKRRKTKTDEIVDIHQQRKGQKSSPLLRKTIGLINFTT